MRLGRAKTSVFPLGVERRSAAFAGARSHCPATLYAGWTSLLQPRAPKRLVDDGGDNLPITDATWRSIPDDFASQPLSQMKQDTGIEELKEVAHFPIDMQ